MTKATRCCCGRKLLTDGEPLIVNDYQHETPGEGRFCGPVYKHELRDLCDLYVQLAEVRAENKELVLAVKNLRMLAQRKNVPYEERRDHAERMARKVGCGSSMLRREGGGR